jgi:hypothetical protein
LDALAIKPSTNSYALHWFTLDSYTESTRLKKKKKFEEVRYLLILPTINDGFKNFRGLHSEKMFEDAARTTSYSIVDHEQ